MQTELSNGVDVHYLRVSLDKFDVRVLAARVPLFESAQQSLKSNPERLASGYSLQDYLRRYRALAVLSGGYIDSYSPPTPLGVVRSNGYQVSPIHQSWLVDGFFCSKPGHAEITKVDMDPLRRTFSDCVQSGPVLLLGNKKINDSSREQLENYKKFANLPYERTFVCLKGDREALLGITGKIELPKLISALQQQPEFSCTDAIGLTGGSSAGLRIGNKLFGKDEFLYPSVIAVMARAQ